MTGIVPSQSMRGLLETAVSHYASQLPGSHAEEYLLSRGITKEAQASFRLGVVGEALIGDERYSGRVAIPYLTAAGVVSIRFRHVGMAGGEAPKYLTRPGDISRLYNVPSLRGDQTPIYVTEGELDCVSGWIAGLPCIGVPGATQWSPTFARVLRFREVIVLADGDDAGRKFADTVVSSVDISKMKQMPKEMDVNDYLNRYGVEGLRKYVGADVGADEED